VASTIHVYDDEYGQAIVARTYLATIATATAIKLVFRQVGSVSTASLTAAAVAGDTTYRAVTGTITSGWLTNKAGTWTGQVEATFATSKFYSEPFTLVVEQRPSE